MRILHYVTGFSTLSETFIYDLITGLEKRELTKNIIVCRKRTLKSQRPFKNTYVLKNKSLFKKLKYSLIDPNHHLLQEEEQLLDLIAEFKPDLIHAHFGIAGIRLNNFLKKRNH